MTVTVKHAPYALSGDLGITYGKGAGMIKQPAVIRRPMDVRCMGILGVTVDTGSSAVHRHTVATPTRSPHFRPARRGGHTARGRCNWIPAIRCLL